MKGAVGEVTSDEYNNYRIGSATRRCGDRDEDEPWRVGLKETTGSAVGPAVPIERTPSHWKAERRPLLRSISKERPAAHKNERRPNNI